jgi:hypothetical protein
MLQSQRFGHFVTRIRFWDYSAILMVAGSIFVLESTIWYECDFFGYLRPSEEQLGTPVGGPYLQQKWAVRILGNSMGARRNG